MSEAPLGLRERKKIRTRAAIQREALRLFREKGYEATTIEEIAEAVEISPSTFFNYFPSKEDVVWQDDLDPLILAAFTRQPPEVGPVAAIRNAMLEVFGNLSPETESMVRERTMLIAREEGLRAAMLNQFATLVDQLAELVATRTGRDQHDFRVRNLAGALLGVMIAVLLAVGDDPKADPIALVEAGLEHLEAGLPLD